jgi:hypothetical protein
MMLDHKIVCPLGVPVPFLCLPHCKFHILFLPCWLPVLGMGCLKEDLLAGFGTQLGDAPSCWRDLPFWKGPFSPLNAHKYGYLGEKIRLLFP